MHVLSPEEQKEFKKFLKEGGRGSLERSISSLASQIGKTKGYLEDAKAGEETAKINQAAHSSTLKTQSKKIRIYRNILVYFDQLLEK